MDYPKLVGLTGLLVGLLGPIALSNPTLVVAQTQPAAMRLAVDRLVQQGDQQFQASQFVAAIESWLQALALLRTNPDRPTESRILGKIGLLYQALGDCPKALPQLQQRLALTRKLGDRQAEGESLGNIGTCYTSLGNYAKAIGYLEQSLVIAQSIKHASNERDAFNDLGDIYYLIGKPRKALEYHLASLAITRKIHDRDGEAISLNRIGLSYNSLADYPQAIAAYQASLVIAREIQDRPGEGNALGNLGLVYFNLGQYEQSLSYHEQSLAIARAVNDRENEGKSLNNLGLTFKAIRNFTKAIEYQQQALAIAQAIGNPDSEGSALANLGITFYQSKRLPEAESSLRSAIAIFEALRTGLSDGNKVSLAETQNLAYQFLQAVLVDQNRAEAALEIAERGRGRAFVELLAARLQNKSIADLQKIAQAPNLEAIRRIAKTQNATLVEYSLVYADLYIWVIKPDGAIKFHHRQLDPKKSITQLVASGRDAIGVRGRIQTVALKPMTVDDTDYLAELHRILIAPIAAELPTDPNQPVIFLPQGPLFLVPFAALKDAQGEYLIEQHTISTAPSIQTLDLTHTQAKAIGPNPQIVVVGDPTMPEFNGQRLPPLPGARSEAIAIGKLLNTTPLIGAQATKAAVLKQMTSAGLIHLATHGLLETVSGEVPGAIALASSGEDHGLLSSGEIFDLRLQADLVVLSACNTGQGEITGDGVVGLSRSLIAAGVPSVIISLWAVNDDSTNVLMNNFYRHLKTNPNKAQALRQAMLDTMQQYPLPIDWAAFTLIGERGQH